MQLLVHWTLEPNETSQTHHEEIYVDDHEDEGAINITDKDSDGSVSFSNAKYDKDTGEQLVKETKERM